MTYRSLRAPISTQKLWLVTALVMMIGFVFPLASQAQGNYVYVNNQDAANSVSAFSVSATGALTQLAGSPYATGGLGVAAKGCYSVNRIAVSAAANALYVSNPGDLTISAFKIDPASGALTRIAGSPFPSGLTLDSCSGISLAATPDGKFLMAASNGRIQTFQIGGNGTPGDLKLQSSINNCCTPSSGMAISGNGLFLALSNPLSNSVSVYNIKTGQLSPVQGSPFPQTGAGVIAGLDFSCGGTRLYGGEAIGSPTNADAWTVSATGVLSPIAGSPFQTADSNSNMVLLSPDNNFLFESNQLSASIDTFSVGATGALTSIASFSGLALGQLHEPVGMATSQAGDVLYVADYTFGVAAFKLTNTGKLTFAGRAAIGTGNTQALAAYPSRTCAPADIAVTQTALPLTVAAGSNVTYTITVTNNGPSTASVSIADNLPAGLTFVSCLATGNGICSGSGNSRTVSFASMASGALGAQTITLVAATDAAAANGSTISNTASVGSSSAFDPNAANNSASASITISAAAAATTITATPVTGLYGGTAAMSATLTSTGASMSGSVVNFSVNGVLIGSAVANASGVATLQGNINPVPVGTYPTAITAAFAGNARFTASSATASLTVNPTPLTVTAIASRFYGDPNPAFTFVYTGFLNSDTSAVVTGTPSCTTPTATISSPVGVYPVTCTTGTATAANYIITSGNGALTINPAPITVTPASLSRLYGDPNPPLTSYTLSGFKLADTAAIVTGAPLCTTTAVPTSAIGLYPIVCAAGTLAAPNYTFVSGPGALTVLQAPLTLTVANASRVYGDPNPIFTGTIAGLKNADVITATFSTAATALSNVGTYPIVPTFSDPGAVLGNYAVVINGGVLTVTPAPLTATAGNGTRVYGDPNPIFSGSLVGIKNADAITATYTSAAGLTANVGTYPVTPVLSDPTAKLGNYTVTLINGVLTVTPAPLSVSVANASRIYGNANPAFVVTYTGLKNADPITANYTTTATLTSPVGTYPITFASFTDPAAKVANYTITTSNGTLTVTQATLSVVGFTGTRVYGDPNPAPVMTGLKNNDPITATYSATSATQSSNVGTYTMVPVLLDPNKLLPNYIVSITNGSMIIAKAPLSVVANSFSRPYGSANPNPLTGTVATIKNNDPITVSFTTTATQTSNAGTFAITATISDPNNRLPNYTLTVTNGTLTITPVPLTIAANSQTVILNASLAGSATYTGFVLNQGPANLNGTLSCSAIKGTGNVGTFAPPNGIQCSGQSSTNYTITFVQGTLTVLYEPATFTCVDGPGHVILAPILANNSSIFTLSATPSIPVQFRVCDVKGTSVSSGGTVASFVPSNNQTPAPVASDGKPFSFVGGALAGGAGNAGWQFNLSTSNLVVGQTYQYTINLNDGTSIPLQFKLQ